MAGRVVSSTTHLNMNRIWPGLTRTLAHNKNITLRPGISTISDNKSLLCNFVSFLVFAVDYDDGIGGFNGNGDAVAGMPDRSYIHPTFVNIIYSMRAKMPLNLMFGVQRPTHLPCLFGY